MNFDQAFDTLLDPKHEGGYSFNPADPGGETIFGITARVARANGYTGDMRTLPRETAKVLYMKLYWAPMHCDELPALLRFQVFDACVNSGAPQATLWLQRATGAKDDGVIGPATLAAMRTADQLRTAILFDALRLDFLTDRPTWSMFGRGWAKRIITNLQLLAKEIP